MSNRHVNRTDISDMGKAAEETEVQRAADRQLMQEGRIIRSKELERRRREEENGHDSYKSHDGLSKTGSNGGASRYSSQRSSVELSSSGSSLSRNMDARELRLQLLQLDEKFKGAMMANVQLDNDKQLLRYEVDLLKDKIEDLVDSHASLHKAFLEKKRDLAYERMQVAELNHRLDFARKQIEARDQLLIEHDLILLGGSGVDDAPPLPDDQKPSLEVDDEMTRTTSGSGKQRPEKRVPNGFNESKKDGTETIPSMALISKSTAEMLNSLGETSLETQVVRLFEIRKELTARVEKLEADLEAERNQPSPVSRYESRTRYAQSQEAELRQDLHNVRSQAQEYKYKLQEALQRNTALESDIVRLEGQIKRYKTLAESCEQGEAVLKQDMRQYIRQLREAKSELEDYKVANARLQRKLDKFERASVAPTGFVSTSLRTARDSSTHR